MAKKSKSAVRKKLHSMPLLKKFKAAPLATGNFPITSLRSPIPDGRLTLRSGQ